MNERTQMIIALISGQDARKWDINALADWASKMADKLLMQNNKNV